MGDFLSSLSQMTPIRISRIEGGTRENVIPRGASCEFVISPKPNVDVEVFLKDWIEKKKSDYPCEENLITTITRSSVVRAMSQEQSSSIIGIINDVHNGPFSWSKVIRDLVETSNNLAIVRTLDDEVKINISSRSSDIDDLEKDRRILKEIGLRYGASVSQPTGYPGWKADIDSPLLHLIERVYESVQGRKPIVTAIHAGLECALFSKIEPRLRVVSIGPSIMSPHSPQEVVYIDSVNTVWKVVRIVAERIGEEY
jgi:dipeptidase D